MGITQRAAQLAEAFETANRPDGTPFARVRDDHPEKEFITSIIRRVHGDGDSLILPVDWLFQAVWDTLGAFEGYEEVDEDTVHEIADGLVDIYTHDLKQWIVDDPLAEDYIHDASREFGAADDEVQRWMQGQYQRYREIVDIVREEITDEHDDDDDESEDA